MNKTSIIALSYTGIILSVLYWSGLESEKRLYDKYLIRSEGPLFFIKNSLEKGEIEDNAIAKTKAFYSQLMDFELIEKDLSETGNKLLGISLPDGNKIYFETKRKTDKGEYEPAPSSQVFKVRNGFNNLHANLLQREKQFIRNNSSSSSISKIYNTDWGREFIVSDPNDNKLFFYESKRKKGSRTKY